MAAMRQAIEEGRFAAWSQEFLDRYQARERQTTAEKRGRSGASARHAARQAQRCRSVWCE